MARDPINPAGDAKVDLYELADRKRPHLPSAVPLMVEGPSQEADLLFEYRFKGFR